MTIDSAADGRRGFLPANKLIVTSLAIVVVSALPMAAEDAPGSLTTVPRFVEAGAASAVGEALPSALPSFMPAPGVLDGMRGLLGRAGDVPVGTAPAVGPAELSTTDFQATLRQARRDAGEARALADELGARAAELSRRLDEDVPLATLHPVAAAPAPSPVPVDTASSVTGEQQLADDEKAVPVISPTRKPETRPDRPVVRSKMAREERLQQRRERAKKVAASKPAGGQQRLADKPAATDPPVAAEAPAKGLFSWFKPFKLPGEMTALGWAEKSSDNLP